MKVYFSYFIFILCFSVVARANSGQQQTIDCPLSQISCAATLTSAFAPNGDLWRLWSGEGHFYVAISSDKGKSFSVAKSLELPVEKISARNENRPKLAFDAFGGVYLSWVSPKAKKYTGDVRFSYSKDYGKSFSTPMTVNDDNLLVSHSFNELLVSGQGEISLTWLDGRFTQQSATDKVKPGTALFVAHGNVRKQQVTFTNKLIAQGTCVCCRLSADVNQQGELAVFWRHIYGDNIREFALFTENRQQEPYQISYDHWQINGCPHQGGALSIDKSDDRYHMIWFNQGSIGKGIFYANSIDYGKSLSKPLAIGQDTSQASHPHLQHNDQQVDVVWLAFNGTQHQLWHQSSTDNGNSFSAEKMLAQADFGADRPFIIKDKGKSYVSWLRFKQGAFWQVL